MNNPIQYKSLCADNQFETEFKEKERNQSQDLNNNESNAKRIVKPIQQKESICFQRVPLQMRNMLWNIYVLFPYLIHGLTIGCKKRMQHKIGYYSKFQFNLFSYNWIHSYFNFHIQNFYH